MIVLREYRDEDLEDINYILSQEKIEDLALEGIVYLILEDKNLMGVAKAHLEDNKYFLNYLIIKKQERKKGFGDGLIRALLYKLFNSNEDKLYFKGSDEYLLKKGFKKEKEHLLSIDIKDFFNNGCKCSGECHGI